jgi:ABC-type sugar transport system substrate-binding protein
MTEILFLVPYRLTRPYFASLYCECERWIYHRHGEKYRLIWRCMTREKDELDGEEVVRILEREIRQSQKPPGVLVVAPNMSKELADGVALAAYQHRIPVLALSLPFQSTEPFTSHHLRVPPVVQCDSAAGARLLAAAAGRDLNKRRPPSKHPRVVLVPGEEHRSDSVCRLVSFVEGLKAAGFEPIVDPLPPCNWKRDLAYEAMKGCLRKARAEIHVAFAANDEMALGVRDAIHERDSHRADNCLIYGFDAVSEVRSLIKDNDRNMKGTVEQQTEELAKALADVIGSVLEPGSNGPPTDRLIPPKAVLPPDRGVDPPFADLVPDLPKFDPNPASGVWVLAEEVVKIERLQPGSLKKYRMKGEHVHWNDYEYGRDKDRRVWTKRGPQGHVYYLRRSLTNGRPAEGDQGGS